MAFSLMSWINGTTKLNSSTMTQFQNNIKNAFDSDDTRISKLESGGGGSGISVPIGGVIMWTSTLTTPDNFRICDGRALSRYTYSDLYSVIGTSYGSGDGSTTFNLPDMRNRFPIGQEQSGSSIAFGVGKEGGSQKHTLTKSELPSGVSGSFRISDHVVTNGGSYSQILDANGVFSSSSNVNNRVYINSNYDVSNTTSINQVDFSLGGSGNSFDIIPPYLSFNFIIRVQ